MTLYNQDDLIIVLKNTDPEDHRDRLILAINSYFRLKAFAEGQGWTMNDECHHMNVFCELLSSLMSVKKIPTRRVVSHCRKPKTARAHS